MTWAPPPVIHPQASRQVGDCAILALAVLTGHAYEDVLAAASNLAHAPHRSGLYSTQIMRIAHAFDLMLRRRRVVDWETDCGILEMRCERNRVLTPCAHVTVLRDAIIVDADEVWPDYDTFLSHYAATVSGILVPMRSGTRRST